MALDEREAQIRRRLTDVAGPEPDPAERALLARLLHSFLTKTPPAVDRLGELLRAGDPAGVREQAHSLKGSASNLGVDSLAAMFARIEHAARDGVVADPELTLAPVGTELALASAVLQRLADEFDGAAQVPAQ